MKNYCTYLTIYKGTKLPPFYIGYVRCKRIIDENYHGSVLSKEYKQIWLSEQKLNPQLFKTVIISLHDTRKEAHMKEISFLKKLKAKKNSLYVNKSDGSLGFYREAGFKLTEEHKMKISVSNKGRVFSETTKEKMRNKVVSEETRKKISESAKKRIGPLNPNYGNRNMSDSSRKSISEAVTKRLKINNPSSLPQVKEMRREHWQGDKNPSKGKIWIRDANSQKLIFPLELDEYLSKGWNKGRIISEEQKRKQSETMKRRSH